MTLAYLATPKVPLHVNDRVNEPTKTITTRRGNVTRTLSISSLSSTSLFRFLLGCLERLLRPNDLTLYVKGSALLITLVQPLISLQEERQAHEKPKARRKGTTRGCRFTAACYQKVVLVPICLPLSAASARNARCYFNLADRR